MLRVVMLVLGFVLVFDAGAATAAGRKCLNITGDYRCPSGLEVYINFTEGVDGGFVYHVEYDDGAYYQFIADDKINSDSEGQYIASCRRKFVRFAFPTTDFPATEEDKEKHKGKDIYRVEEYTLGHRGKFYVDIYYAEIPEGNMNNLKKLENKTSLSCEKM